MLQWALKYLNLGLSVIPLKPNGKEPLIVWAEFQKRRAEEAEVVEWFQKRPTANVGIVTGMISGIVIVDLDGQEGLDSARSLGLESSVVSLTGNGKHLWYRIPDVIVGNSVRQYPGIDVRGEGGYVVAPPSVSPNGRRYRWLNQLVDIDTLTPFPVSFLKPETVVAGIEPKEESWIAKALGGMKDGNIDNTVTSILGRMRNDNWSREDARVLLEPHMVRVGAEVGHLEAKIENVWNRYEPKTRKSDSPNTGNLFFSGVYNNELVIHSPSNPNSWEQFNVREVTDGSKDLKTGYPKLDQMLEGGLKSSRLLTVAARTGVGKTNFLIGIARNVCEAGKRVLLFSTEMPYAQIWERYIETLQSREKFRDHEFYVCDSFAPNLERVEEAIRQIKPDVFMFDHINHVSEEQHELGAFMQGLNFLGRKYETAGIVTAQLNRSADWVDLKTGEKVMPRMSMIKGSGTIEQASSRVLLLSETRVTPEGTEIVGNLDKNDRGSKGLVHFMLKTNPYRMEEL